MDGDLLLVMDILVRRRQKWVVQFVTMLFDYIFIIYFSCCR